MGKIKVIIVLGQTATGKSDLGVRLAKKFNGEIISADSRQVYKGLDIGTGKITKKEGRGVPHHLLDVVNPRHVYTAAEYTRAAAKILRYIAEKERVPIVVGGTGFYIDALLGNITLSNVPPDKELRVMLEKKTTSMLLKQLEKLDPVRAQNIDTKNRRRIIRAIEIAKNTGETIYKKQGDQKYDVLKIGIKMEDAMLKKNIKKRLLVRLKQGMIAEARKLHKKGLSWRRMEELGLEYQYLSRYLRRYLSRKEMVEKLNTEIWRYARRQKTWFKRDKNIQWFTPSEYKKIERNVNNFLS